MDEFKWLLIAYAVVMGGFCIAMVLEDNNKQTCRAVAIQAGKSTAEIKEICGK